MTKIKPNRKDDINKNISSRDRRWQDVFDRYNLHDHDFYNHPYFIKAKQIKAATKHFETTGEREVIPILQNVTTDRLEYHISRVKGKIWQEFIR